MKPNLAISLSPTNAHEKLGKLTMPQEINKSSPFHQKISQRTKNVSHLQQFAINF